MILLDQIAFGPARKPYQIVVLNPDLQIRGGHPDPEIRGEPQSQKKFYSAPRVSVWSNNNKGGGGGALAPLDPPPDTASTYSHIKMVLLA